MDRSGGGYDTILRPDTNTFIGSSSTLGRKSGGWGNSILNGGNTSPRHNFRSLGRSGVGGGGSSLNIEHLNNRNNKMSAGNKHSSRNGLNGSVSPSRTIPSRKFSHLRIFAVAGHMEVQLVWGPLQRRCSDARLTRRIGVVIGHEPAAQPGGHLQHRPAQKPCPTSPHECGLAGLFPVHHGAGRQRL